MSYSPHIHMLERPKAILYRFIDVFITEGRLKFDYMNIASVNLPLFLDEFFNQKELLDLLEDLRQQSYDERENDPTSPVIFKSTQTPAAIIVSTGKLHFITLLNLSSLYTQGSVCFYINWRMKRKCKKVDLGRPNGPDYKLIKWVVAHAMAAGRAAITVHERFVEALKKRHGEGIKQYVYSRLASPAIDTEHKLFAFTSAGDLSGYIDGYFSPDFLSPSGEWGELLVRTIASFCHLHFIRSRANELHSAVTLHGRPAAGRGDASQHLPGGVPPGCRGRLQGGQSETTRRAEESHLPPRQRHECHGLHSTETVGEVGEE